MAEQDVNMFDVSPTKEVLEIEVLLTRPVGRTLLSGRFVATHVQNLEGMTTLNVKKARRWPMLHSSFAGCDELRRIRRYLGLFKCGKQIYR